MHIQKRYKFSELISVPSSTSLPLAQPYVLQNKTNLSLPAYFYLG